jgi:tol-pal system protein YbgF
MVPLPVSCVRFAAVLMLAAMLVPAAARSQDRSTGERLDRIERDLNMLQRQVYRGAPSAMAATGDASNAANVEIRMERLEAQMRDLTGRVEEIRNGIDQMKQRVEQINSDIDVRLGQTGGTASSAAPPPARPGPRQDSGRVAGAGPPPGGLMPPGTVVPPPGGPNSGLNPIFNTLTPPGSSSGPPQPPPPAPSASEAEPASAADGGLPSGSAMHQFNYAFGLVKQADYPGAEAALKSFIRQHPKDPLAGNAHYWLGETYYARNKYTEAAAAFAEGYKRFPKGSKAADDLLKLAMSLAHADQKKNACVVLAQLDQAFPHPGAAIRERAGAEKKRLGCG